MNFRPPILQYLAVAALVGFATLVNIWWLK
jgi:hypothetical protein